MRLFLSAVLLALAACGAPQSSSHEHADTPPASHSGAVEISGAWAAPTPGGVDVAAGYVTITNGTDADDRVISASSPRAAQVDIHSMSMEGAVMQMRVVEGGLAVGAGQTVTLSPGGLHLMFTGVAQPFQVGEEIPLTLTFEHAGPVETTLPVRVGGDHTH